MSMKRKIYGIFVAAGSGTRMGGDTPKQFMSFEGKPVLHRNVHGCLAGDEGDHGSSAQLFPDMERPLRHKFFFLPADTGRRRAHQIPICKTGTFKSS